VGLRPKPNRGGLELLQWAGPNRYSINKLIQLAKYEKNTSSVPKIFKLCMVKDKFKRNIVPVGKKFKFQQKLN
jgi:hypothetical protein